MIYLDHNATTPVSAEVRKVLLPFLDQHWGNPSSSHALGRTAHEAVDRARAQVAALIGSEPDEIVFTSGGTESSNLAIRGTVDGPMVTTTIEHPATIEPAMVMAAEGNPLTLVGPDPDGRVTADRVLASTSVSTSLVSVMHANNETGALQPIEAIGRRLPGGVLFHVDAAQSVGKIPVDVNALSCDLLSITGHKLYAPKGIGALYVRRGTPLQPLLYGGGQEDGQRPGTENVPWIVALGAACAEARDRLEADQVHMTALRDRLHHRLLEKIPDLRLNGPEVHRLPNTLNISFPGVTGEALLERAENVLASTGSACHAGTHEPSPVLTAMGVRTEQALGAVRLTVGRHSTQEEIDRASVRLIEAWQAIR